MTANAPVAVLGGTGHYGRHVVRSLCAMARPVRVMTRDVAAARGILGEGPEIVVGNMSSRDDLVRCLGGARGVVIAVSAFSWKQIRKLRSIERDAVLTALEVARETGVRRVVYISVYEPRAEAVRRLGIRFESAAIKADVEDALARSDLDWTVLGAPPSMEIFFAMTRGDKMTVPGGGPPALPTISPADAGEVAARAVLRDDLGGRRFRLAGPEAMSFADAARRISAATGRTIRVRRLPLLPIRIASIVTAPFNPYLKHLFASIRLLNKFPQDLAADVPKDHRLLVETFGHTPTTLEMEIRRRAAQAGAAGPAAPGP